MGEDPHLIIGDEVKAVTRRSGIVVGVRERSSGDTTYPVIGASGAVPHYTSLGVERFL